MFTFQFPCLIFPRLARIRHCEGLYHGCLWGPSRPFNSFRKLPNKKNTFPFYVTMNTHTLFDWQVDLWECRSDASHQRVSNTRARDLNKDKKGTFLKQNFQTSDANRWNHSKISNKQTNQNTSQCWQQNLSIFVFWSVRGWKLNYNRTIRFIKLILEPKLSSRQLQMDTRQFTVPAGQTTKRRRLVDKWLDSQ